jgi:hypothetical protein
MNNRFKGWRLKRPSRGSRGPRLRAGGEAVEACFASDAGLAAAPVAAPPAVSTSLATLLTRHVLRDGEIILLVLKPSLWTILFSSLPAIAAALIVMISAGLWLPHHTHIGVEIGLLLIAVRAGAAVMSWAGKLYLLTDLRIVRIAGVLSPQIHDIPLRKVARTRLVASFHERVCRVGSIEIIPESDQWPWSVWQTVACPQKVHDTVRRAIVRAKQGTGHVLW